MAKNSSTMPVLALILSIPAVACYVWWTHLNTETRRQLTLRVRSRTDGVSFGAAMDRNKLNNPIASLPVGAASAPVSGMPAAPAPASGPRPAATPVSAAAAATLPAAAVPAGPPAAAASAAAVADQAVVIVRDPMVSPFDIARLRQIEYEKEQARLELEREEAQRGRVRHHREPSIEARIELEGIIATDAGNRAIINGETVSAGNLVEGAKVVRITAQSVVFAYKNRRFSKWISK